MDAVLQRIKSRVPTNVTTRSTAGDVLTELRTMNNNNIEFFEALALELNEIKKTSGLDQARIKQLEDDMNVHKGEVETKLQNFQTQLNQIQADLNAVKQENIDLRSDNVTLLRDNKVLLEDTRVLKEKTLELECRSRKRNLIISKIPEERGLNSRETYDQVVTKVVQLFRDKLGINDAGNMLFRNVHRLGKKMEHFTRPRNIIVAFLKQEDVERVLQAAREMRDTSVSIRTDLPKDYNEIRNALLTIRAQYRDREVNPIKCKLSYIKFKPVLFKPVQGQDDVEVQIEKDADGKYHEIVTDDF